MLVEAAGQEQVRSYNQIEAEDGLGEAVMEDGSGLLGSEGRPQAGGRLGGL